jgi:hypothetical protein
MAFTISFGELWTYAAEQSGQRLPVSELPADGWGHIHGRLEILVNGRVLPGLGFFGPTDVCFNEWLRELLAAAATLKSADSCEYIYDEGEQGQPAYLFARRGAALLVSVVDSEISGGQADPDWQNEECDFTEFANEVARFESSFREQLLSQAPAGGAAWLRNVLHNTI